MSKSIILGVAAVFLLGACTGDSSRSAGERISTRGVAITQFGDSWTAGASDVQKGERLTATSEKQIMRAQQDLSKARSALAAAEQRILSAERDKIAAQQMVADGTLRMQRAEADYAAVRSGPSANPDVPPPT
jgi:hypothetical protein